MTVSLNKIIKDYLGALHNHNEECIITILIELFYVLLLNYGLSSLVNRVYSGPHTLRECSLRSNWIFLKYLSSDLLLENKLADMKQFAIKISIIIITLRNFIF